MNYREMNDEKIKAYLLKKMTEQWMRDNRGIKEDIEELVATFVSFNVKWGTQLDPVDFLENKDLAS